MVITLADAVHETPHALTLSVPSQGASFLAALGSVAALGRSWSCLIDPPTGKSRSALTRAFYLSLPAKYIPGGFFQHVDLLERTTVAASVSRRRVLGATLVHAGIIVVAALSLGALTVLADRDSKVNALLLFGLASPLLLSDSVARWLRRSINRIGCIPLDMSTPFPTSNQRIRALLWTSLSLIASGASFAFLLGDNAETPLVTAVFGFSLAFLVGFVAVPVPAGLGIREIALAAALPGVSVSTAVLLSTAHRVIALFAEGTTFFVTFVVNRLAVRRGSMD